MPGAMGGATAAEVNAAGASVGRTIWTGGAKYKSAPLADSDEKPIFFRDLARIAYLSTFQRELSSLLLDESDAYMTAAQIAKASIGSNPAFNGVSASGNEIGFRLIRAADIMSNTSVSGGSAGTAAEVLNWVQAFTANGWADFFGSSAHPVTLNTTGVSGKSATNFQNNTLLAFGSLLDPSSSPILAEYRFHIAQRDYGVNPISWMPASNLFYARFAGFVIIPVNGSFYMRGNIQPNTGGGQTAAELFGLTFQPGTYLFNET